MNRFLNKIINNQRHNQRLVIYLFILAPSSCPITYRWLFNRIYIWCIFYNSDSSSFNIDRMHEESKGYIIICKIHN